MEDLILRIENLRKTYPGVVALNDVSFTVKKGEVHALVGENGAGKSTLIKCIMGVEKADSGHIYMRYNDTWVEHSDALESQSHGVFANYQHVNIAPELSIAENYFLGRQPRNHLNMVDWTKMNADSQAIIDKFKMNVNSKDTIKNLPIAMQAMVTISKISVNEDIRLVIFDEPTALLENEKVDTLFQFIRELKEKGVSIIYISHRLEEIMEICDSVSILKDGQYVDTKPIQEVNKDLLISMMVGRQLGNIYQIQHFPPGQELLRVEDFSDSKHFRNIHFKVHAGEILGFAGLVGAGRSELMSALFGVKKRLRGEVYIKGQRVVIKNPSDAMENGLCFLTEDRRANGLALNLSIQTNINMCSYKSIARSGLISLKKEQARAEEYSRLVNVKTPSILQYVGNLSGGNQQKVVIAKLLCTDPEIFIFDEPTVGIDVGSKHEIYQLLQSLTAQGKAVLLISSYLPEVMGMSDRLIVMSKGEITAEFSKEELRDLREEDVLRKASL